MTWTDDDERWTVARACRAVHVCSPCPLVTGGGNPCSSCGDAYAAIRAGVERGYSRGMNAAGNLVQKRALRDCAVEVRCWGHAMARELWEKSRGR